MRNLAELLRTYIRIYWQCLFFRQNADSNGLAGAIVPPVRSLAETK